MVRVELDVIVGNLDKIRTNIEKAFKNASGKGNGGGRSVGAVAIGGAVAILGKLLNSVQSVVSLLEIIGGLINQLVAPFVPILLGLIKPVFVLLQKFLFKALATFGVGGFGTEGGGTEGNLATKIGIALAAITGAIAAVFAGGGFLLAVLGALVGVAAFDLGTWLGDQLFKLVTGKFDFQIFLGDKLADLLIILDEAWESLKNTLSDSFGALGDILSGVWTDVKQSFVDLWNIFTQIFIEAFTNLNEILSGAGNILKSIWESFLSIMKTAILNFANLFIDGLNGLIKLLNIIPGIDIGRVGRFDTGQDLQTTINVTIQGNTNEDTVDTMLRELRKQQQRRGLGSF